ncbi:MAG: DsbC family protein [Pseudomonadales bacterium]
MNVWLFKQAAQALILVAASTVAMSTVAMAEEYLTQQGDTLADIASKVIAAEGNHAAIMRWLAAENPTAFIDGKLDLFKANVPIKLPQEMALQESISSAPLAVVTVPQVSIINAKVLIVAAFQRARPDWQLQSIKASPIAGVYEVQILNGPLAYASSTGGYFIAGDLYQIASGGFVNLAKQTREQLRAQAIEKIALNQMIIFSPEKAAKTHVTVFTDIDCGYCRKLHKEVPELNRLGIEVRYLAYPRAGIGSESYKKIATAWCSEDRNKALTQMKMGQSRSMNVCDDNPVAEHFNLGQQVGVTGTPALVTASGELLPGYMPAKKLAEVLGVTP